MTENLGVESPDVRVPRQVTERVRRAMQRREQQSSGSQEPQPAEPAAANAAAPASQEPQPEPAAQPEPARPADPREGDPAYWRQRFQTAEGLLRKQRDEMQATITELNGRVLALQAELASARATQAPAAIDLTKYFTAEQLEMLGEEQARIMAETIEKAVGARIAEQVEQRLAPLAQKSEQQEKQARQARINGFLDALTDEVADWREIDQDSRWHAFLAKVDENTGLVRQDIVDQAKATLNAAPIAKLLKQFVASLNPKAVPTAPPVIPQGAGSAGEPGTPAQTTQGHLSAADIRQHYKLRALGKLSAQQIKEFDARIAAASAAGLL